MKQSTPRIRSIRFKSGGEIRLLPPVDRRERQYIRDDFASCLATQKDIAGYSITIWGADQTTTTTSFCGPRSTIPVYLVPDFVRAELLGQRIERRTVEEIERRLGYASPDDDPA